MATTAPLWTFTESISPERRKRLLAIETFQEVIRQLQAGKISLFAVDPRPGFARVFFRLLVTEEAYDAFFNSPKGYRAQYCLNSAYGAKQNRRLVDALTEACLSYSESSPQPGFPRGRVIASLGGVGAKVWITESDLPDGGEVHINYEPWLKKAQQANVGAIADQAARANAGVGVLAPIGTQLEIKGAWVSQDCTEWLDPKKAHRDEEIRDYGFT